MAIRDLLKAAEKGDRKAVPQLLERAAAEDPRALAKALGPLLLKGEKGRKRKKAENQESRCLELEPHREKLLRLLESTNSDPARALPELEAALDLAGERPCYRVQLLGMQAQAERMLGDLGSAEQTLEEAWCWAQSCRESPLDVRRRQGVLLVAQGRHQEGRVVLNDTIERYRMLGFEGHDLYGYPIGSCLFYRAQSLCLAGDHEAALSDFGESLQNVPVTSEFFGYVVFSLSLELSHSPDPDNWRLALDNVGDARRFFHGRRERSMQRARLDNLEGNLRFLLKDRVSRGRKRLRRSIRDFLYLDMKAEAVASAADLSRTYLGKRVEIREVVANLLDLELPGARELRALHDATLLSGWDTTPEIKRAITRLRAAVADFPGVLACLYT